MCSTPEEMEKHLYFPAELGGLLKMSVRELRSEPEYDADTCAEKSALKYLLKLQQCFNGEFFLATSSRVAQRDRIRSYKGVLWGDSVLQSLKHHEVEIDLGGGNTRIVAVVNLDKFTFTTSEDLLLNWGDSLMFLTDIGLDDMMECVQNWIARGSDAYLAFDYEAIAKDLRCMEATVVLRYFPADNGRSEVLVAVGRQEVLAERIDKCLASI